MRNAYYARDNFDVRRGGRGFSCAVKNTLISQKDAVDTRTFRVKPNTPKLLSMPGKNGGQLWDLPSISMITKHNDLPCADRDWSIKSTYYPGLSYSQNSKYVILLQIFTAKSTACVSW